MKCRKCGSENVNIQAITTVKTKKHKGLLYWLFIGWWLELFLLLCFGIFYIIAKIIKKPNIVSKTHNQAICQSCGNAWKI